MVDVASAVNGRVNPHEINQRNKAVQRVISHLVEVSEDVEQLITGLTSTLRDSIKEVEEENEYINLLDMDHRRPLFKEVEKTQGKAGSKRTAYNELLGELRKYDRLVKKEKKEFENEVGYVAREARYIRREISEWKKIDQEIQAILDEIGIYQRQPKQAPVKKIRDKAEKILKQAKRATHQQAYVERWDNRDKKVASAIQQIEDKKKPLEALFEKSGLA